MTSYPTGLCTNRKSGVGVAGGRVVGCLDIIQPGLKPILEVKLLIHPVGTMDKLAPGYSLIALEENISNGIRHVSTSSPINFGNVLKHQLVTHLPPNPLRGWPQVTMISRRTPGYLFSNCKSDKSRFEERFDKYSISTPTTSLASL